VRLEGAAAGALEEVFREDWRTATGEVLEPSTPDPDPGDTWVHVIPSGPNQAEERLFPLLFAQLAASVTVLVKAIPLLLFFSEPSGSLQSYTTTFQARLLRKI
jgi:hypothetical protein